MITKPGIPCYGSDGACRAANQKIMDVNPA